MADHTEFLELARELISEEGRSVTFQRLSAVPANNAKPWWGAGAPTVEASVTTLAVFLPDGSGFGKMIEDNELFKSADQMLLVAPPETGEDLGTFHVVVDGGSRWRIEVAKELKPANLTVLFAMGVCR